MKKNEMKKMIEEARIIISGLALNEDLDFTKALISGKIETTEHKEKHLAMLDLIKRLENLKDDK
jgi:hypothetical protein